MNTVTIRIATQDNAFNSAKIDETYMFGRLFEAQSNEDALAAPFSETQISAMSIDSAVFLEAVKSPTRETLVGFFSDLTGSDETRIQPRSEWSDL
jgi:hypothetical protein